MDACTRGLSLDPSNTALKTLLSKLTTRQAELTEIERKRAEREARTKKEAALLKAALVARGIRVRNSPRPPEMEDAAVKLVPDPLSPTSALVFPVTILYPLHLQSDFVKAWGEEQSLGEHLDYLLPLPWDARGEYKDVEGYVETMNGGLMKVGKKVPLLKVLGGGKVEVLDSIVKINVVPKARAPEWIEEVKKRKGKA